MPIQNIGEQEPHHLLKKRQSFLYENEIRIMVVPDKTDETNPGCTGYAR